MSNIDAVAGNAEAAVFSLCDTASNSVITSRAADIEYYKDMGEYIWSFVTPDTDDNVALFVFAGANGETNGNILNLKNVSLSEYK